jgi:rare lipoprotein A
MSRAHIKFLLASSCLAGAALSVPGCATAPKSQISHAPDEQGEFLFHQEGLASWYGPGFHGRKTASGERYDQGDLTCAHRKLPFGTKLKVTNLRNGQELVLTVNDRGPFVRNRIVDVSHEAAKQLDFLHEGTVPVRLERMTDVEPPQLLEAMNAAAVDPE